MRPAAAAAITLLLVLVHVQEAAAGKNLTVTNTTDGVQRPKPDTLKSLVPHR